MGRLIWMESQCLAPAVAAPPKWAVPRRAGGRGNEQPGNGDTQSRGYSVLYLLIVVGEKIERTWRWELLLGGAQGGQQKLRRQEQDRAKESSVAWEKKGGAGCWRCATACFFNRYIMGICMSSQVQSVVRTTTGSTW